MGKYLIFVALTLCSWWSSCSYVRQKQGHISVVLSSDSMAAVLTDVHLTEAVLAKKQTEGKPAHELAEIYYDSLFAKYNITRSLFDSSLFFYSRNPEDFNAIYSVVITNLSKIESDSTGEKINFGEEVENRLNETPK